MAGPNYLKGRTPIKIPLHSVMDILKSINDLGHTEQFRKAAEQNGAFMSFHPKTVNFVKDYLVSNNLHEGNEPEHQVARSIVGACPEPRPYDCPWTQE